MKEYIERELLLIGVDRCISALHAQAKGDPIQEGAIKLVEATRDYIASLSAADVAPVVRCRECEYYDENGDCISLDLRIGIHSDTINYDFCPDPDFYCAYGRRKIETVLPKSDEKDESLEGEHD